MQSKLRITLAGALIFSVFASGGAIAQEREIVSPPPQPLPLSSTATDYAPKPLTYAQQIARFTAVQNAARIEWNKWIGYDPARPYVNASYMSNGLQRYYIPRRGVIVSGYHSSSWYW